MRLAALLGILFSFAASANANTFLPASGKWARPANWTGGVPTLTTATEVPAGRVARIEHLGERAGSLTVAGQVTGFGSLKVAGNFTLAGPETFELNGTLDLIGMGSIDMGGADVYYLETEGYEEAVSPVRVAGDLNVRSGSTFISNGWPVTVGHETYPREGSTTVLGTSVFTTGEWLVFQPGLMALSAENATIVIDAAVPNRGLMKGQGWTYGNVTLEGASPESRSSYTVNGTLAFNRPTEGVVTLQAGQTITASSLSSDGTEAEPVQVVSSEPGHPAYIHCGCSPPAGVVLTDVVVF